MKVAAIQFCSKFANPARNRQRLERYIRQAAGAGAHIVVLPELAITGYADESLARVWQLEGRPIASCFRGASPAAHAETHAGPSVTHFSKLAGELRIYLTIPLLELDTRTQQYFNAVLLAGPDGTLRSHYRKLNPWPMGESGWATPGDRGLQVVDTEYGRLASLICYDIHFEPSRLKQLKIDTLLFSTAWVDETPSRWLQAELPRLAKTHAFNLIAANWTISKSHDWFGYGQSLIVDRRGEVLASVRQDIGEEIIYAEITTQTPGAVGDPLHQATPRHFAD